MSRPDHTAEPNPAPEPEPFGLEVHRSDRQAVWITPRGEIDLTSTRPLAAALAAALDRARLVVLDLRRVSFMDSAGVTEVARAHHRASSGGRRLVLIRGPRQVERLLALTGLSEVLEVADPGGELHHRPTDPLTPG